MGSGSIKFASTFETMPLASCAPPAEGQLMSATAASMDDATSGRVVADVDSSIAGANGAAFASAKADLGVADRQDAATNDLAAFVAR